MNETNNTMFFCHTNRDTGEVTCQSKHTKTKKKECKKSITDIVMFNRIIV